MRRKGQALVQELTIFSANGEGENILDFFGLGIKLGHCISTSANRRHIFFTTFLLTKFKTEI